MKSQMVSYAVLLILLSQAHAVTFTFTKVVDTATPIPGGTGTFTSLGPFSLDQGNVALRGVGAQQEGIYLYDGGTLTNLVDTGAAIPDGVGNFTGFSPVSLDGMDVAFAGGGDNQGGIYTVIGGVISKIVDLNTPIPDGTGTFAHLDQPTLDVGAVAFVGSGPLNQFGIYLAEGGSLTTVADTNTLIPDGTGDFEGISSTHASLDGGQVAFAGHDTANRGGIYVSAAGTITKIADGNTPVPGGVGTFDRFEPPVIDEGVIAFKGSSASNQPGIYLAGGGTLTEIITDVGPNGQLSIPSVDAEKVAFEFEAHDNSAPHGIYTNLGGVVTKVIDVTDTLDGKPFNPNSTISFSIGSDGLSGNQLAFRAVFADGSQGIFLATLVPEPSSLILLALAGLAMIGCGFNRCHIGQLR